MTDVLILHRFRGLRPGSTMPYDESFDRHVKAGNAKVLPSGDRYGDAATEEPPVPVLTGASTGVGAVVPNGDQDELFSEFDRDDEDTEAG